MSTRNYGQACSVARFLDQLGSRWTLLLVRDLLVEPRRFKDLLANAPTMGPNLLTTRLREMMDLGIVEKDGHSYALTAAGRALEPIILSMSQWALRHMKINFKNPGQSRPDLLVVALRGAFNAEAAGVDENYELHIDDVVIFINIADKSVETGIGPTENPAFVLAATSEDFDLVAAGVLGIEDALATERFSVSGSRAAFDRFLSVFGGT